MINRFIAVLLLFFIISIAGLGFIGLNAMDFSTNHNCSISIVGDTACPMSVSSGIAVAEHHVGELQAFGQAHLITLALLSVLLVAGIFFIILKQFYQQILFIQRYYLFRIRYFKRKPPYVQRILLRWFSLYHTRNPYAFVRVRC